MKKIILTFANMNTELNKTYHAKAEQLAETIAKLKSKSRGFILGEILSFALAIGFIVLFTLIADAYWALGVAMCVLLVYFYIRNLDAKNDRNIAYHEALRKVYEREISYQEGNYAVFDAGERYLNPTHAFTYDLDIFGNGSLFQRINRTISSGGSDYLSACLAGNWEETPRQELLATIQKRSQAIEELSRDIEFVSQFKAQGVSQPIDTQKVKDAFKGIHAIKISSFFANKVFRLLTYTNLVGFYLSIFLSIFGLVPALLPLWWGMFNFFLATFCANKYIKIINEVISKLQNQVRGYVNLATLIDQQAFSSAELTALKAQMEGAKNSLGSLERILQKIDNRSNEIGIVLFNCFGLIDITIVRHFLRWQRTYTETTHKWIEAASVMDALVSMATFTMNEDKAKAAKVVDDSKNVRYSAVNLYHPFLGEKAVKNDFDIRNLEYYIITGANMAGKSTFLRTLGVNYILAMNGLPVFADKMEISFFRLFTNMRTTDDLTHGISYFNAELLRLKQLIGSLQPEVPSLIILDEILKGTNSLDKLNGSRLFLKYIAEKNVTGVIATHDLELSKLEEETPARFHNYCFEIQLGEHVTYSYKITKGVARNQNATFLLKGILQ